MAAVPEAQGRFLVMPAWHYAMGHPCLPFHVVPNEPGIKLSGHLFCQRSSSTWTQLIPFAAFLDLIDCVLVYTVHIYKYIHIHTCACVLCATNHSQEVQGRPTMLRSPGHPVFHAKAPSELLCLYSRGRGSGAPPAGPQVEGNRHESTPTPSCQAEMSRVASSGCQMIEINNKKRRVGRGV